MGVKNSPQGIYFVKVHRKNEAIAKKRPPTIVLGGKTTPKL